MAWLSPCFTLFSLAIPCQSLSHSPQPSVWKLTTLEGVIFGLEADDCSTSVVLCAQPQRQAVLSSRVLPSMHCMGSPGVPAMAGFLPCPPSSPSSKQTLGSRMRRLKKKNRDRNLLVKKPSRYFFFLS